MNTRKRCFVDTSALVALADRSDQYHKEAAAYAARTRGSVHFVTTDYVLDETATRLRSSIGHTATVKFLRAIFDSPSFTVVTVEPEVWRQAWMLFEKYEDQPLSFTDCVTVAVMRGLSMETVFAFDRVFRRLGLSVVPEAAS
ncbi:MAG: PIN domain-containing protein [Firmicutes bacterium]|nr:PIN domain-containing protein [Bacillota bacterium]